MFAVTVTFSIHSEHFEAFLPLMRNNAAASKAQEPGCHQFDIATDAARPTEIFLYELYEDANAFQVHLAAEHFKTFDAATAHMIATKTIRTYETVIQ